MSAKIKIPKGYRRLKRGEKLRAGDRVSKHEGGFMRLDPSWFVNLPVQRGECIIRKI